jgi:glycosyltransferase involved in cell wall biosynthesis
MASYLVVFAHPAPYKVHLFNSLAKHIDITVVFEREMDRYSRLQYLDPATFKFKHFWLKGIAFGQHNHVSLELIHHLKTHRYDHIIMNGYSTMSEILTILYLQKQRIPYYLYINGGVIRRDPFWRKALKRTLIQGAKGYFSPSVKVDPYLIHYGANPKHIYHYPYSTVFAHEVLKAPLSPLEKSALRTTVGLPSEGRVCLAIGQFIPRKNFLALIQAWQHVAKDHHLVIVGDGPLKKRYEREIQALNLSHVTLRPFQPKSLLLSMLRASDVFALMSKEDIYGHVINEALSQGVPVLASEHIVSAQTLIEPGRHGMLMPLTQMQQLPKVFNQVLLLNAADACLEVARANTIEIMTQKHLDIFSQLGAAS